MRHSKTGYTRCSPPVCLMLTTRIPGTWEIFAKRPKSGMCLHPISPMNRELDEKRWSRWKGQKIYRKDILKNKKHSPEKRCYIFFWKVLCVFEKDATSSSRQELLIDGGIWILIDTVTTYFFTITKLDYSKENLIFENNKSHIWPIQDYREYPKPKKPSCTPN